MKWSLTAEAFDKLLSAFSGDRDQAALQYETLRAKLVRFFEWRSVEFPDARADETIDRVARRIYEGVSVDNVRSYVYGVARMVLLEALKERERAPLALENIPEQLCRELNQESESEPRLKCFDQCLETLSAESRELIMNYYQEERRAKIELRLQLAEKLRIPLNALRIRAHRIRVSLEKCITECLESPVGAK